MIIRAKHDNGLTKIENLIYPPTMAYYGHIWDADLDRKAIADIVGIATSIPNGGKIQEVRSRVSFKMHGIDFVIMATTFVTGDERKVLAQIESRVEDGCVPLRHIAWFDHQPHQSSKS